MNNKNKKLIDKWKDSDIFKDINGITPESVSKLYESEAGKLLKEENTNEFIILDYNEVYGDLITLANQEKFDVIAHGCNCMSQMGAGIAVPMKKEFGCDTFPMELKGPNIQKLGNIDYKGFTYGGNGWRQSNPNDYHVDDIGFYVVNAYTQFHYGRNQMPLDYEALTLCMRKMNSVFRGKHIGLPQIGAGLAGGDWNRIKKIIQTELKDCKITVVIYKP